MKDRLDQPAGLGHRKHESRRHERDHARRAKVCGNLSHNTTGGPFDDCNALDRPWLGGLTTGSFCRAEIGVPQRIDGVRRQELRLPPVQVLHVSPVLVVAVGPQIGLDHFAASQINIHRCSHCAHWPAAVNEVDRGSARIADLPT